MKKQVGIIAAGLLALTLLGVSAAILLTRRPTISAHHGHMVRVEVVKTPEARDKGLSGRRGLESHHGMLFIFENEGTPAFWMKDMSFPIDIIWIDKNWKVVYIHENVQPDSYPERFLPPKPIKYVLEVNGNESREHLSIEPGVTLTARNIE